MKIGIDIDGVLTNIEQFQLDYGSKFMYENYKKEIVNPGSYEVFNMFSEDEDIEVKFWAKYWIPYIIKEPARKHAGEVISKLKSEGNEIYIITARYLSNDNGLKGLSMQTIVKRFLKKYKIPYDKLIFTGEDKREECKKNNIDVMIEDSPYNINSLSKDIKVICFDAKYNESCKGKNIIRCYSWYDIYVKLEKIKKDLQ